MSHIPRVEKWLEDVRRRMEPVPETSPFYLELKKTEAMYVNLLANLREIAEGKQRKLPMREPGEDENI